MIENPDSIREELTKYTATSPARWNVIPLIHELMNRTDRMEEIADFARENSNSLSNSPILTYVFYEWINIKPTQAIQWLGKQQKDPDKDSLLHRAINDTTNDYHEKLYLADQVSDPKLKNSLIESIEQSQTP